MVSRPNVLLVMTDEERYPPPYEDAALQRFRRDHLPARDRIRNRGVEFHRHYAASTACLPSRASLFTGQYPSLHGVVSTDGLAKSADDPAMRWLDPSSVPTLGDWFRAAGYGTHYRGKWHISHADLLVPGTHDSIPASDANGAIIPAGFDAYRRADRLDPYGFSGWIGREPHGADKSDTGLVRDGVFAEQVSGLFETLAKRGASEPWLAVASFVNPHDIAFSGVGWQVLGFPPIEDFVPSIDAAPSQSDSFAGRPRAQQEWQELWPQILYVQPTDEEYRRLYYWLHARVDLAIGRILDALDASGMADDTIVIFTSDHGDMLGAHGGMQQKWHNAFDESIRVPMYISGPGVTGRAEGVEIATSHVDVIPTLLALVGADVEAAAAGVAAHHVETQPLPGRDLSPLLTGGSGSSLDALDSLDGPIYFMTEDQISRGLKQANRFNGTPITPVAAPAKVESVITRLPTGEDGALELWKLNHYYDTLPEWEAEVGVVPTPTGDDENPEAWELHNLSRDPEERANRADAATDAATLGVLRGTLETARRDQRRVPAVHPVTA